ncbi:MAG TPA: adenylate/guanylate cyclase domain-containing protein [Lachnospiraceae bacterium]|nr:adenylate/guanylate cyclase domain-containing protein [Lachnospiraceae bacterium]
MHIFGKTKAGAVALLIAGGLTLLAGTGILDRPDLAAADALYQQREASDGRIVLVGIDEQALEEYGPYQQWGRDILAETLEKLNRSDSVRPAVIAIDILYTGETGTEADTRLAEAAGRYGNVITAAKAEYDNSLIGNGAGDYVLGKSVVMKQPYAALENVTVQGHINVGVDRDGVLRHHLLEIVLPDGSRVPSMALEAARMYRESRGEEEISLPPVDGRGFWYLPFCGAPEDFEEISLSRVLSGEVPAESFSGKIVFIGPYAAGLQDSYITAADHTQQMYGVEYQANAVQALLWGRYKKEAGNGLQLALLFLILLAAMAGFWQRPVKSSTLLWAVLCGGWIPACRWLYGRGYVFHVLWVPVGVTVLYVGSLAANYIRAALDRRRVTGTFERYVAPEIVGELLKEGSDKLALGGKLATIAVLFVDVRGFTSLSELLPPEEVVQILNRYLTLFSDCILRNGGTLDKFVGDQAMAFWGEPLHQEDYVIKAVRAAVEMVEGGRSISEELKEHYGRPVSFGIGIHLGEAVVGNIGSHRRMDYTAVGDTVNTAARLEANAPGGSIYISRAVADALAGRIEADSLGDTVKLKGKKEGFEVLELKRILGGVAGQENNRNVTKS